MIKRLNIVFLILISVCISLLFIMDNGSPWSNGFNNKFGCKTEDITNMYADYIESWKQGIKQSFEKAEAEVLTKPDDVVGPDPDPKKCICKGSGIIVHGDGHKTICPYHGKKTNSMQKILSERDLIFVPLLQVE